MDRYLDIVQKYQGKPLVAAVIVWDTFLEGGRYTGQERYMPKPVKEDRTEHGDKGPEVTLLDRATGKTSKLALPRLSDPRSRQLWKPVLEAVRARLKQRGWPGAMAFGFVSDTSATKEAAATIIDLQPDVPWFCHAHSPRRNFYGKPMLYQAFVWPSRFPRGPQTERTYGWQQDALRVQFPRSGMDGFHMVAQRSMAEMNITGGQRGFGRLGGDTWHVLKDGRGRRTMRVTEGRFPKGSWRALNIVSAYLAPGPGGPIATTRLEMQREGIQECEARIFIERALLDKKLRAKLGEELATRAQKLLDERTVAMLRGMSPFTFTEHFTGNAADNHIWWSRPGGLSPQWFVSSGWQKRSEELYSTAAEIGKIIGSE